MIPFRVLTHDLPLVHAQKDHVAVTFAEITDFDVVPRFVANSEGREKRFGALEIQSGQISRLLIMN